MGDDAQHSKSLGRLRKAWGRIWTLQSAKGVGQKLIVNGVFWLAIIVLLWLSVGRAGHIRFLTPDGAEPLSMKKILDFADGDLWMFQVLSGGLLQASLTLARRIKCIRNWATRIAAAVHDELASACLNFGSLFIISGFYYAFRHDVHFLVPLFAGFFNVIYFSFWSEYKAGDKDEEKDEGKDKEKAAVTQLNGAPTQS